MRRFVPVLALSAAVVLVPSLAPRAEALTIRDVIELSRAGLGDDVLLALIEVDGGVFAIDVETLKALKDAGVSERVIVALVRSRRERPEPVTAAVLPPEPAPAPEPVQPQVVVIDHAPVVQEVFVPVPVYVGVPVGRPRYARDRQPVRSTYVPFQSGPPVERPVYQEPERPVYWGFGGKLRPDAWKPARQQDQQQTKDADKPAR